MEMEKAYQQTGGINSTTMGDFILDFDNLTSMKKGASKSKHILRGLWFYHNKDGSWQPYEHDIAGELETAVQSVEKNETKLADFKVKVTDNPPRYVIPIGVTTDKFKQIRETKNANPSGREVLRGYNGSIYKNVTPF